MKLSINTLFVIITICTLSFGCEDFLEEENRSAITIESAESDPETFGKLINAVYSKMRDYSTSYDPVNGIEYNLLEERGTDIVTRLEAVSGVSELNDYVNLNSANYGVLLYWRNYYDVIASANVVIENAEVISGLSEEDITKGVAEVKFFRAWSYFNLVENFGDVPLILYQISTAETDFERTAEADVYEQIILDLDDALAGVEEAPSEYGEVSKDAVRHLKAKVLLTRGYKSYAGANDFAEAASLAETVITNNPLVSSFASLVDIENQRNSEVIFSFLFGNDAVSMGWGNSRHMQYKFEYFNYPGMVQSDEYQRGMYTAPTPFFYSLFSEEDERAEASFRRVLYAQEASDDGTIQVGDTAVYFPQSAWSQAEINAAPYVVINPGTYFNNDGFTDVHFPMFRKFDNPGAPFVWPDQPPRGTRDMVMMRSGESVLIAAEAYLQAGNISEATAMLNSLRVRAGITAPLQDAEVDIDVILDERARELAGEVNRWMDLKRTSKLIERTLAHNPHAALNHTLSERHLLRPIPQTEIDISGFTQNPDYN